MWGQRQGWRKPLVRSAGWARANRGQASVPPSATTKSLRLFIPQAHERMAHPDPEGRDRPASPRGALARPATRLNRFRILSNEERPHDVLAGRTPATLSRPSPRPYTGEAFPPLAYPGHDIPKRVTNAGTIRFKTRLPGFLAYLSPRLLTPGVCGSSGSAWCSSRASPYRFQAPSEPRRPWISCDRQLAVGARRVAPTFGRSRPYVSTNAQADLAAGVTLGHASRPLQISASRRDEGRDRSSGSVRGGRRDSRRGCPGMPTTVGTWRVELGRLGE